MLQINKIISHCKSLTKSDSVDSVGIRDMRISKGFTLTELIVTITILAILGTIGYISIGGQSMRARDSTRVTNLRQLDSGLRYTHITRGRYPLPDAVYGSGQINGAELYNVGYARDKVAVFANINIPPKDPLTQSNYIYGTDINNQFFQIATVMEGGNVSVESIDENLRERIVYNILPQTHAADGATSYVTGNYQGILKVLNTVVNVPSLLIPESYTGPIDVTSPTTLFIVNGEKNLPYLPANTPQGNLTPGEALSSIGSEASSVTGVIISDWSTNSGAIATTLGYDIDEVGVQIFGVSKYAAGNNLTTNSTSVDSHFSQLGLLLHGNGPNGGTNGKESSPNHYSVDLYGDVLYSTDSPFSGQGGSLRFDGAGDYITTSPGSMDLGAGDFTVEFWMKSDKQAAYNMNNYAIVEGERSGGNEWIVTVVSYGGYNGLTFSYGSHGSYTVGKYTNNWLSSNVWQHIAITRQGTNWKIFVDGQSQVLSTYNEGATWNDAVDLSNPTRDGNIGGAHHQGYPFQGNLSNFRILKGTALYTSNFTPSTTPLTVVSNTSLFITGQSSNDIIDSVGLHQLATYGNAQLSTLQKKFGSASIDLDGSGDFIGINSLPGINFGNSNFTMEAWIYRRSVTDPTYADAIWCQKSGPFSFGLGIDAGGKLGIVASSNGSSWDIRRGVDPGDPRGSITIPLNTWTHISVVRDGSVWKTFVNGVEDQTFTSPLSIANNANGYYIGRWHDSVTRYFNGYIDDFRITKGVARYPSSPIPTSEFPDS